VHESQSMSLTQLIRTLYSTLLIYLKKTNF